MKRFISALAFCFTLLVLLSVFLFPPAKAKENVLLALLNLPAPPPPNPLVAGERKRDGKFYDKDAPPKDDAPLSELLDYWKNQSEQYRDISYNAKPSDRTAERIMAEIEKDPDLLSQYLNILPDGDRSAGFVKDLYEREGTNGAFDRSERGLIKRWLTYHTPFYSSDLMKIAEQVGDTDEYVSNQEELLALARVDFDKAQPIINRLYGDSSQKVSQVLAKWILYRHAMDTGSTGDIERYRDELKAVVEDKRATPGMRDLGLDALTQEKDWTGRDEWYYSLLSDETLADLRVNGQSYTGLTTILLCSPDDKYVAKMLELVQSENPTIRTAAIKNLVLKLNTNNPEIVKALLPWLEDPKWAGDVADSRSTLVSKLSEIEMPESVPGLIKMLDEKPKRISDYGSNTAANRAVSTMANVANAISARPTTNSVMSVNTTEYYSPNEYNPLRDMAVNALAKQKDPRAVPALRRILPEGESYQQNNVIKAILACHGFSVVEQLDALETSAKRIGSETDGTLQPAEPYIPTNSPYANANAGAAPYRKPNQPPTAAEIRVILGTELLNSPEITDELARGIVDRIEVLDQKDKQLASAYRKMILRWQNAVINLVLLRDVKRGMAGSDAIVRLLAQRKVLREQQSTDVFDIRTGEPVAAGIAACLLNDASDAVTILDGANAEAKTALLACSRLIRMPLPVEKVAESLKSTTPILVTAAERYLESEDSPEARSFVLARHPGEAKILGATTAFAVESVPETASETLFALYQSMGDNSLYNGWYGSGNDEDLKKTEKRLQEELKKDAELVGVYAYDRNYIRIYKDRVIFSWDEDNARYRERPLSKYEFEEIKTYIATNQLDQLPPFLSCGGDYCVATELIMLGKNGGRRVYVNGGPHEIFTGLAKYFADLKRSPATLKYGLSREIPGLEIVLASDELHAETVWKDGPNLKIAASEKAVRKKIAAELEGNDNEPSGVTEDNYEADAKRVAAITEKRRFEGFAWYQVADGVVAGSVAQPADAEFIPARDGLAVQPSDEQWKARAAGVELRTSADGLFKILRGKLVKIHSGFYSNAVVTPNGRWALVYKTDEEAGEGVYRIDLLTNKEYPVVIEGYGKNLPMAYLPTLNKILVVRNENYEYGGGGDYGVDSGEENDTTPDDAAADGMVLVDPATGATQPINGEFRPLAQQTFRSLQKTAKPNEFWAAMPDSEKNETQLGVYDTKTFSFRIVLKIPKIKFNSMNMWVDESGSKAYFVYRGHLLALPLPK